MKFIPFTLLFLVPCMVGANPIIPEYSVTLTQPHTGTLYVTYALENEPAIVTVDFLTNGVSIGENNFTNVTGDVNRKVLAGTNKKITWRAYKTWPDRQCPNLTAKVTAWSLQKPPQYMVVNLKEKTADAAVRYYASSNAVPGGVLAEVNKTERLVMRKIEASGQTFHMQTPIRRNRLVSFTNDYYFGVFELTQGQYVSLGFTNPSAYKGDDRLKYPLTSCSLNTLRGAYTWPDKNHADVTASSYVGVLRKLTEIEFDLPTDAQWEYACRAGTETPYFFGSDDSAKYVQTYSSTKEDKTFEVGLKLPNPWGIYDIYGNVLELTLDRCVNNSNPDNIETLPEGHFFEPVGFPKSHSTCCTTRGGKSNSIAYSYERHRVDCSGGYAGNGFRLACPAIIP